MKAPVLVAVAVFFTIVVGALTALVGVRRHSAASVAAEASLYRGSIPPPGIRAPNFTLSEYRGKRVTMSKLRGRVVVLSFVDSKCTQKCPIVTSVLAQTMKQLPARARDQVVALLMSVDPKVDTDSSIERFLARRDALDLSYLVAPAHVMRPIWKAYGILAAADTGNADLHSSDVRVFNQKGIWVSTQHAGVDLTAKNLRHDTLQALKR